MRFGRLLGSVLLGAVLLGSVLLASVAVAGAQERVVIDAAAPTTPLAHFWEESFGSGRAALTMREDWRDDLRAVRATTGIRYVRFHGVLDDDMGVYTEDEHGNAVYNFAYVDHVYDGLLRNGVKPLVEISFMPKRLAFNPDFLHPFWYKPNVSPPKSWEKWDALMGAFARHLVERYGADEVASWYFEVWNEPNIDFWAGVPRLESYEELYDHTARALKGANARLRVGGPATSAAAWIPEFLEHTRAEGVPVDFVSTHGYSDEEFAGLFAERKNGLRALPYNDRTAVVMRKTREQMAAAGAAKLPLLWTEWNPTGQDGGFDSRYMAVGVADMIRQCDGLADLVSFWTFSDVFEEGGPIPHPFENTFGMRAEGGINKPSFYGFGMLHKLGDRRLANASADVVVTKAADGAVVVAAWNLVNPGGTTGSGDGASRAEGEMKVMRIEFRHVAADARVTVEVLDREHGDVLPIYKAMGSPGSPTLAQVEEMNRRSALGAPEERRLRGGVLELRLEPNALALVRVAVR